MNRPIEEIIGARHTLYIPVVYGTGVIVNGTERSGTHYGIPCRTQRAAWAAAREMCEQMDGVGFCVRRADPVKETTR